MHNHRRLPVLPVLLLCPVRALKTSGSMSSLARMTPLLTEMREIAATPAFGRTLPAVLPLVDQQRQTLLQDITADSVWGPTALLIVVRMVDLAQLAVREMLGELKGGKAKRVFVEKIDKLRSTLEPRSANLEQLVDPVFGAWADMVEGIADQQRVERKDAFKVAAAYQPLPPGQVVQLPAQQHMPAAQPPLYPAPYPPPPSSRPFKGPQTQVPERAIFGMGKGATDSQILQISISVASKQHMSWVSAPTRPSLCRPFRAIMPR